MAESSYSVIPAEPTDMATVAKFIYASNLAQATNRFLFYDWPNESAQMSLYLSGMESTFKDPNNMIFKVIDKSNSETIGSLILGRKMGERDSPKEPKLTEPPRSPEGVNSEFHTALKEALEEVQKKLIGLDHFILSSIFVAPSYRKQGIGSQLVELCIERARSAHLPLFLSAVPTSHCFYTQLGFKDISYADVDLSKWTSEYSGYGIYRLHGMMIDN